MSPWSPVFAQLSNKFRFFPLTLNTLICHFFTFNNTFQTFHQIHNFSQIRRQFFNFNFIHLGSNLLFHASFLFRSQVWTGGTPKAKWLQKVPVAKYILWPCRGIPIELWRRKFQRMRINLPVIVLSCNPWHASVLKFYWNNSLPNKNDHSCCPRPSSPIYEMILASRCVKGHCTNQPTLIIDDSSWEFKRPLRGLGTSSALANFVIKRSLQTGQSANHAAVMARNVHIIVSPETNQQHATWWVREIMSVSCCQEINAIKLTNEFARSSAGQFRENDEWKDGKLSGGSETPLC